MPESELSAVDHLAISEAPVVFATPAVVSHRIPQSTSRASTSAQDHSASSRTSNFQPDQSQASSPPRPPRPSTQPRPSLAPPISHLSQPQSDIRRRLWPVPQPSINYTAAASQSIPIQPQSNTARILPSTITQARSHTLHQPIERTDSLEIGDRVVILDNYLNLYGTIGTITEVHRIQVTLRVIHNNKFISLRKKKSKVAKVVP